jgi:hypothetical protein
MNNNIELIESPILFIVLMKIIIEKVFIGITTMERFNQ